MVASDSDNGQTGSAAHPLSGQELLAALAAASAHLTASAKAVDAINVYPVPDGDTGSNMAATLREAVEAARVLPPSAIAGDVLAAVAKGALFAARGNSGVILSQALQGIAEAARGQAALDAATLAAGLAGAARMAYRAVTAPVEGTMLTVLGRAGDAAVASAGELPETGRGQPCLATLAAAIAAAEEAERRTIEQLPALTEAGVTDAGGEGVCVILRGLAAALRGTAPPAPALPDRPVAELAGHQLETFGYCTEFVLEPAGASELDPEAIRGWAVAAGHRSVAVVGSPEAVRVHLHADDGEAAVQEAAGFGTVSRVKVEDMARQHEAFRRSGSGAGKPVALLAISRGLGFVRLFDSFGAHVADLGDLVKPPAGSIAAAADALRTPDVIVLANHPNVVLAARQAASLTRCTLRVLETTTFPQGLAAALAFDAGASLARNLEAMAAAAKSVTTVEVTTAAADRTADGVTVRQGDAIALVDGRLVAARADPVAALIAGLDTAGAADAELVAIYSGEDATSEQGSAAMAAAALTYPGVEVELHEGGQAIYTFIASVER